MCFNSISVLNKLVTVSARLTHSLIVLVQLSCHLANYTVSQKELRLFFCNNLVETFFVLDRDAARLRECPL